MNRFLRLLAIGVASLAALPAFAAEKITLLYVPVNAYVTSYVAKDQGFFARHGLEVELKIVPAGGQSIASLMADSAQIATTTPTQLLQANEQGFDIVAVGGGTAYPVGPATNGVLAKTGSGIKAPADLVGKKVGIPGLGSTQELLPKLWLRANGIDERQVQWIEVQFPQLNDALKAGIVDAGVSTNPFLSRAIEAGIGTLVVDFNTVAAKGAPSVLYVSRRSWAEKNRAAVQEFRQAFVEAVDFVNDAQNRETVQRIIAQYTQLPPQIAASLPMPVGLTPIPQAEGFSFWIDASQEFGLTKTRPDPKTLIAE
jgi:NitT/TauT family transport system substrate-binding protein